MKKLLMGSGKKMLKGMKHIGKGLLKTAPYTVTGGLAIGVGARGVLEGIKTIKAANENQTKWDKTWDAWRGQQSPDDWISAVRASYSPEQLTETDNFLKENGFGGLDEYIRETHKVTMAELDRNTKPRTSRRKQRSDKGKKRGKYRT